MNRTREAGMGPRDTFRSLKFALMQNSENGFPEKDNGICKSPVDVQNRLLIHIVQVGSGCGVVQNSQEISVI